MPYDLFPVSYDQVTNVQIQSGFKAYESIQDTYGHIKPDCKGPFHDPSMFILCHSSVDIDKIS